MNPPYTLRKNASPSAATTTSAGASSRRCAIEEYDRQVVLPHEYTRQEWVLDRVRLMGVTGYNYSSLLVLFRDDLRSTVGGILRAVAGGDPRRPRRRPICRNCACGG